jgi:hypothetical protein
MSVNVSLFAGAGWQFFDSNGVMLSGGLVYSYVAGTSTPQSTYTTSAGNVAHANPIVLDASGRVPSGGEVWATDLAGYKFVLKTSAAVTIGTYDNLTTGVSASTLMYDQGGVGAVSRTVTSKLQEWISVEDFGAVADGVTDSTAAFNAALLAAGGQYVFVPSGAYYISGLVTGAFFSVGSVTINNGTVVTITNLTQVFVTPPGPADDILLSNGTSWVSASNRVFPTGTKMLFVQTAAPTGWTKILTDNDSALRVVSGSVSSGGTVGFIASIASSTSGATTLSTAQMPAHTHSFSAVMGGCTLTIAGCGGYGNNSANTGSTGGGGSHTHSLFGDIKYVDAIYAVKT